VSTDTLTQLLHRQLYDHLQADYELLILAKMRKTQVHLPVRGGRLDNLRLVIPPPLSVVSDAAAAAPAAAAAAAQPAGPTIPTIVEPQEAKPQGAQPPPMILLQSQPQPAVAEEPQEFQAPQSLLPAAPASPPSTPPRRRSRAASSPLKADAAAAAAASTATSQRLRQSQQQRDAEDSSGAGGAASGSHHLSDYLKFMNPGSWRSLANSIRQKVSSLREQRHPKVLGPTAQVNFSVDRSPEDVRDAVQYALINLEGARTKSRGFRFHTTIHHPRLFRDEVKLLVEVCNVFGAQKTETGVKISRVKGEMTSCITASREVVKAVRAVLEASSTTPKNIPPCDEGPQGLGQGQQQQQQQQQHLHVEEEGRRRANSDSPQKPPLHFRNPQVSAAATLPAVTRVRATADTRDSSNGSSARSSPSMERSTSSSSSSSDRTPTPSYMTTVV
jgi:hypothetical protein